MRTSNWTERPEWFSDGNYDWHVWVAFVLCFGAIKEIVVKILEIGAGRNTATGDVRLAWEPVAENVLAGAPLYQVPEARDIKPPGWLYLTILSEAIGPIGIVLLAITALANALAVYLVYQKTYEITDDAVSGLAAGAMVMLALNTLVPYANNKIIIAVLGLLAITTDSPRWSGVSVGVALSIVQYGILLIPGVGWWWWKSGGRSDLQNLLGTASIVFAATFLPLFVWGWRSFVGGILYTFGVAWPYLTQQEIEMAFETGSRSLVKEPWRYYNYLDSLVSSIFPMPIFATFGAAVGLSSHWNKAISADRLDDFAAIFLMTAFLSVSLLIRPYAHYVGMVAVPMSILAGVGVAVIRNQEIR